MGSSVPRGFLAIALCTITACADGGPPDTGVFVLSYNLLYRAGPSGDTLDLIQTADPDVLCLQELTPAFLAALGARVGDRYPHRIVAPAAGTWGVGILSKRPLTDAHLAPQSPDSAPGAWAQIPLKRGPLSLSCHHLMPPQHASIDAPVYERIPHNEALRQAQSEAIALAHGPKGSPALILGDLNAWTTSESLDPFRDAGFQESCEASPGRCAATFPASGFYIPPIVRIDHAFARDVDVLWTETLMGGGSDHRALGVWIGEE